ncbi:hypothetical protein, partial, partial [Absidia glauca]
NDLGFGWVGYLFCDLVTHTYIEEKKTKPVGSKQSQDPVVTRTTHTETYDSLAQSLDKNWSTLSSKALKKRISPVAFLIQSKIRVGSDYLVDSLSCCNAM